MNYDTKYMHTASRPHSLDVYGDRDQTRGDHGASDVRVWWMSPEETSPSVLFPEAYTPPFLLLLATGCDSLSRLI